MGDYLEAYAARFGLPVRSGVAVERLTRTASASSSHRRRTARFEADNVVVASGAFQTPDVPAFARELDPRIMQLHSSEYRNPAQLQDGRGARRRRRQLGRRHRLRGLSRHIDVVLSGRDNGQLPAPIEAGAAGSSSAALLSARTC